MDIDITVPLSVDDIVDALFREDHITLLDLIVKIDQSQQDWGFTEMVYEYFAKEMIDKPEDE